MNKDTLGTFEVKQSKSKTGYDFPKCKACGKNVPTAVTYQQLEFAEKYADIDPQSTLLKKGMTFGIECGCYAKLHRQVAHIHDKMNKFSMHEPVKQIERTNG